MRLKRARIEFRRLSRELRSRTSEVTWIVSPPKAEISSQTMDNSSERRPVGTTVAPCRASPNASARPMPEVAPMQTAIRPVRSNMVHQRSVLGVCVEVQHDKPEINPGDLHLRLHRPCHSICLP